VAKPKPKRRRRHFKAVVETGAGRHEVQMVVDGDDVVFHLKGQRNVRYRMSLEKMLGYAWRKALVEYCEEALGTGGSK
jgi:hypothetical protein